MNHNFLIKNYLAENGRKVNEILRWVPLVFLILCPALLIMKQAGVLSYRFSSVLEVCIFIIIICIFPLVFSKYAYNEELNRCICLTVIEFFVGVLAVTEVLDINMLYALVPMLSILYVDSRVFFHSARNCFLVLVVVEITKYFYHLREWARKDIIYQADYMGFVALVLEYCILMCVVYYLVSHMERMVASGYKIKQQEEGIFLNASGSSEHTESSYNTKGLFLEITHRVEAMTQGQSKKFVSVIDEDLPGQLKGDSEKMKLALVNMLSDMVRYTQSGEIKFEMSYEKGITLKKGQNITLVCRISCDEDITEQLKHGNALGFALGKNMIQKLEGMILDKSSAGLNRTHYVISFHQMVDGTETIRQLRSSRKREQDMLIAESRRKAENLMYVKAGKALIVDDNEMNQKLVAAILKSYGLESVCVSSGEEAVKVVQSKEFNLMILDYMMPEKCGIQIAKEIRQFKDPYFDELPMIAMTTNNTEESKAMFYSNRFAEVISKPIKEDELRLAIALCMCL